MFGMRSRSCCIICFEFRIVSLKYVQLCTSSFNTALRHTLFRNDNILNEYKKKSILFYDRPYTFQYFYFGRMDHKKIGINCSTKFLSKINIFFSIHLQLYRKIIFWVVKVRTFFFRVKLNKLAKGNRTSYR